MINCFKKFFGGKEDKKVNTNTNYNMDKSKVLYVSNKDVCDTLNVPGTKYYKLENEEVNLYLRCRYFGSGNKRTREKLADLLESINRTLYLNSIKIIPAKNDLDDESYVVDIDPFIDFRYIDFVHYEFERGTVYMGFTMKELASLNNREISGIIQFKNASKDCMINIKNHMISKGE